MSIARIAKVANVSPATVWRILNNHASVAPQTVATVRRAIDQVGYQPTGRRGRRRKAADGIRTHNIALLLLRHRSVIGMSIMTHVQKLLAERNLNLIFADVKKPDPLPQAVRSGNVDGILCYGEFAPGEAPPALQRIPAVWMMSRETSPADEWGDRVRPDHQAVGRIAADYLLRRGHSDVAYFNPSPGAVLYFRERGTAFCETAQGRAASVSVIEGPQAPPSRVYGVAFMEQAAEQFVERWLAASPRPTGVFVPVDRMTVRVYQHLLRRGIRPGSDLEIISCDNEEELLSLIYPAPVSIDLNRQEIAAHAVERLLRRMRDGMSAAPVVITVSPALPLSTIEPWRE